MSSDVYLSRRMTGTSRWLNLPQPLTALKAKSNNTSMNRKDLDQIRVVVKEGIEVAIEKRVRPMVKETVELAIEEKVRPMVREEVKAGIEVALEERVRPMIREEVRPIVQKEVGIALEEKVRPMIRQEVRPIVQEEIKEELKPLKSDVAKIRRDLSMVIEYFEQDLVDLRKRVDHIEPFLNISSPLRGGRNIL